MLIDELGKQDSGAENWPLEKLSVFSADHIQRLNENAINTFGQLLGATKGLSAVPAFLGDVAEVEQIFKVLEGRFPVEVERYREDRTPFPATGCWVDDEHDKEASEGDGKP